MTGARTLITPMRSTTVLGKEILEREDLSVGGCQAAQAVELVRALRVQLHEMTSRLAWVERQDVTRTNGRACAMRMEASALRRDIKQAEALIDQLEDRYLSGDEQLQERPPVRQPRAMRW
jgi:hypothetical protein